LSAEELREACNEAVSGLAPITRENRVHSGDLTVRVWASEVEISGRGWGHAVGMCQWCAKGFADLGWDWRKMIGTFYPESSVEKAY
jgi:stage II sporulation protein D